MTTDTAFYGARTIKAEAFEEGTLIVETDGITLDFAETAMAAVSHHLRPDQRIGRAIVLNKGYVAPPDERFGRAVVIRNAKNVTVKNGAISGFKVAIYAEDSPGLTIENCDVSNNYRQRLKSTPEKEDESDWLYGHENDKNEWLRYGAGIYLLRCDGATVKNCRARNGQNGICLVRCNDATVVANDMSFMSGWGLAMWRSNRCKVIGNRFDYCVRGYSHGVYARGQDSTGILVYEQCSDNVFAYNHATHGGDGFFLYAGNETVNKTGEGGCNRNLVIANDFSYAIANGIEATFSDQNMFIENILNECHYGIWAGYSRNSFILQNQIERSKTGIAIEHGQGNRIIANEIKNCPSGICLWYDDDQNLMKSPYCEKQGCQSRRESVEFNRIKECKMGILGDGSQELVLAGNRVEACEEPVVLKNQASINEFAGQVVDQGTINGSNSTAFVARSNFFQEGVKVVGPIENTSPARSEEDALAAIERGYFGLGPCTGLKDVVDSNKLSVRPNVLNELLECREVVWAPLRGAKPAKEHILMTEWGPWDFNGERPGQATTRPARPR
ncbi:MAG TPA: right-handed parallel beta-helix repeat-containing protein [Phycisphaerae bacterium]|nr:right-handed parallel beta-helix repeat-containing protein [Phycisphaerae bacterium]